MAAFKLSCVKTRYFEFEAPDNGRVLLIEPPKLKTLKEMEDIQKDNNSGIGEVAGLLAKIISKNKGGRKVSAELVLSWMDIDQMQEFLGEFMDWMRRSRKSDPN